MFLRVWKFAGIHSDVGDTVARDLGEFFPWCGSE